ncbi:MAG: penicillin-binding protein 2 [Eggerthellaceae bacterium]|nr:penicillin-binding protein 2 [Eggerthellaceae bacterium]
MAARGARSRSGKGGGEGRTRSRATTVPTSFDPGARLNLLFGIFALLAVVIAGRLVFLTLVVGPENAEKAADTRTISVELPARRGTIYDRNGIVLAKDVDASTIYCNPYEVTDVNGTSAQLAAILGGESTSYIEPLSTPDTSFAYIFRKADKDLGDKIEALGLEGIYTIDDSKRVYPCGQTAGQVVGICDVDGQGLTGLELYYDDILSGENGELVVERGQNGFPIAGGLNLRTAARDGEDIMIAIDLDMQEYLEARLAVAVSEIGGKTGNALLYDAGTGEIVAIASTPFLDPGDRENIAQGAPELKGVTASFEPGSIFKTVSAAAILEEDVLKPSDTIMCPSYLPADEYFVSDAHDRADETMSFRDIIARSSNVGISLASEKLGFSKLYDAIMRYNLNEETGVDYPGEGAGFCADVEDWSLIQSYNVSFGQGITVTPLQMSRFYGAIINDGVECTPHLLVSKPQTGEIARYSTEKVFENTEILPTLQSMLKSVVAEGTATDAQIEGFEPAGKTGTAEYALESGSYAVGSYNISFVGFLPDTTSQLVCFVGVTEVPGDRITTPAFRDIMEYAINHYRITPQ